MTSGIYLIGKNLELPMFSELIEPYILQQKLIIPNKTGVPIESYDNAILLSLRGTDLDTKLSNALLESFKKERENVPNNYKSYPDTFWEQSIKIVDYSYPEGVLVFDKDAEEKKIWKAVYRTIGVYEDDKTASNLFASIALPYYVDRGNKRARDLEEKLKKLANSTFGSFGK